MRLLNTEKYELEEFGDNKIPLYAILSHTWGDHEITFQDVERRNAEEKAGYEKVRKTCSIAAAHGFKYVWIDTCCTIQTHHRRQCPTKTVTYAAENGGRMYIVFQYENVLIIPYPLPFHL
ncbi:hypothetical protein GQ44DRAFT_366567 [Phaeosphaeriaceae sp. PMI808]|nr:hypothetical protein GQ44DRAFT_366567 [Phaeosphaeriaceae sp. PMI808]